MSPKKKQRTDAIAPEGEDEVRFKEKPGLLTIARELRDMIYSLVLVEDHEIDADHSLERPGLLSVCRQTREEALPFWYQGNIFTVPIFDCNSDLLEKFQRHLREMNQHRAKRLVVRLALALDGIPNWANLLIWCKRVHAKPPVLPLEPKPAANMEGDLAVMMGSTQLAKQMRELPWEKCEEALQLLRPSFGHADADWLRD